MSTQAELIKDCLHRIRRLEYALQAEPESNEIKKMLEEEKELLDRIEKAN